MDAQQAGKTLLRIREARGYSMTEVAKRAGVSHTTVRNYERGIREDGSEFTPNEGKVMKVAAAFPPQDRAEILEAFGLEEMAKSVQEQTQATATATSHEGQRFTVVGMVAGSKDTIIVRDEEGQHRIFRELKLRSSPDYYGPDEAPF